MSELDPEIDPSQWLWFGAALLAMTIMALVVAVMYFLVFRPQNKKAQEQAKMLSTLKRNDEVVTTGGIIGRIQDAGDKVITLEVAPNVRLRIERSQIAGLSTYKALAKKDDK